MMALAASMVPMFFRMLLLMEKIGLNMGVLLLYQKIVVDNEGKMRELGYSIIKLLRKKNYQERKKGKGR